MPHPIHKVSDINAILSVGLTIIHCLPCKKNGVYCVKIFKGVMKVTHFNYRATPFTFLSALFWFAFISVNNSYSIFAICFFIFIKIIHGSKSSNNSRCMENFKLKT
jgi:hypothetical protein